MGMEKRSDPKNVVENILNMTNTNSKRNRLLPSFIVFYLVVTISYFPYVALKEGLRIIFKNLRNYFSEIKIPVKSAITKARKRMGSLPFKEMFETQCKPLGTPEIPGCYYLRWRLMAVDGSKVECGDLSFSKVREGFV